jgi:hypothetical protein
MTLLFLRRLNDTFEKNAEKLIKQGKSQKEAYENKNSTFFKYWKKMLFSNLRKYDLLHFVTLVKNLSPIIE